MSARPPVRSGAAGPQHGSALVVALFVITLLTGLGTALLFLSQHETRRSRTSLIEKQAFYLAESGIEDGRLTLFLANGDGDFDNELAAAAGLNGVVDFDVDALEPAWDADGTLTGVTGYGDDVPLRGLTTLTADGRDGSYVAFLTNDPIERRTTLADANERVMLTAVGAGPRRSLEVAQAIVEPLRLLPPIPPAALTLLGSQPAYFDNGNSNAQRHTGNNCGVAGGAYAPIVGTVSPSSRAQVQHDMRRPQHFTSGPFTGTGTVADLTDLSDPIVAAAGNGILDPMWNDCAELKALIEDLVLSADYYCNSDLGACSIASMAPGSLAFIDGDLTNTPAGSFSGTLVVTGQLTYRGNTSWSGLVLVVGEGRLIRSGGGNGTSSGGVIVAAIDPTPAGPAANKSDWCTTGVGGFLQAYYDSSGGGTSTIRWCTAAINAANGAKAYRVVDFLQR